MREMGPSFVTVAAQGFYRSRVRNCYPLPTVSPFKDSPFLFNTKTFNGIIRTFGWGVIRWKQKIGF